MVTNVEATTLGTVRKEVPDGPRTRQFQGVFDIIIVKVPVTEASIAAQVGSSGTFTVPGAALGDFVQVAPGVDIGTALQMTAVVSAANTVRVNFFNAEGTDAVTTLAGGTTFTFIVLKPRPNGPVASV